MLSENECERCQFYLQHFIKVGSQYIKTGCGHCVQGYIKRRRPADICKYFEVGMYDLKTGIGGKNNGSIRK